MAAGAWKVSKCERYIHPKWVNTGYPRSVVQVTIPLKHPVPRTRSLGDLLPCRAVPRSHARHGCELAGFRWSGGRYTRSVRHALLTNKCPRGSSGRRIYSIGSVHGSPKPAPAGPVGPSIHPCPALPIGNCPSWPSFPSSSHHAALPPPAETCTTCPRSPPVSLCVRRPLAGFVSLPGSRACNPKPT